MASSHTRKMLLKGENNIPHLYKDTKGNLTIGVGYLVSNLNAALKLGFIHKTSHAKASQEDIRKEYDTIAALPSGKTYAAEWFRPYTKLVLSSIEIDHLFSIMLAQKEKELALRLPLEEYPEEVRQVLIDMAYNAGTDGLFRKFPRFIAAIKSKNWEEAAKECHSGDVGEIRNQERKSLLEKAMSSNPDV
jgi:GH24 family phage-related lysozyme (muramidase)